jgi:UDP-N-acetylmuramoyl-L-alanyl-D-glutamate--2,6-diaminopimelate ligase
MPSDPPTLARLAAALGAGLLGDGRVEILDVTHDSRLAGRGKLFVAVRGLSQDGHRFVPDAIAAGAAAVCVERDPPPGVPAIIVPDTRSALGPLAAEVHGHPAERLALIGVTGTNGKTTVTHLIEAMAEAAGETVAVAGTVGARIAGRSVAMSHTTPEASDFQRLLAEMVEAGVRVAAVEVSSHALALGRVEGTRFHVAAFTNLSQDHLDFHGTMEDYFEAKARLFTEHSAQRAVVWVDDPHGRRLLERIGIPVTTVGTADADIVVTDPRLDFGGTSFDLAVPDRTVRMRVPLAGRINAANAAVAAACAAEVGIDWDSIAAGAAAVTAVPGRFEIVETSRDCTIVVDYAHTPDGISAMVAAAREMAPGSGVIVVVGAGGDRDRAKRRSMGAAAAAADIAVFTSDNPRSEDPDAILDEIEAGAASGPAEVIRQPDRRLAIRAALHRAGSGDVVLLLGKGHEQGQQFSDRTVSFDDRVVALEEAEGGEVAS